MMNQTRAIGWDPATVTGYAYQKRDGVWVTGVVSPSAMWDLQGIIEAAKAEGVTMAGVEDCYLSVGMQRNVVTLKRLQAFQTRVVVECERMGLKVKLFMASEWQSAWRISGKREARKIAAMKVARQLGANPKTEDEADAVCIAKHAQRDGPRRGTYTPMAKKRPVTRAPRGATTTKKGS